MKMPNNYGSIQKMPGNRRKPFRVVKTIGWTDDGKQIRKTLGYFETRTKAMQELAIYNENPYDIEYKTISVEKIHEKWQEEHYPKIAYKTIQVYNACWKYCSDIADEPFINIKTQHLQAIIDSMGDKWSTKKAFKNMWNQLYDYAIKSDMNVKKYSTYLDLGKKAPKLERIPFEQWEIDKMWENVDRMPFIDTILILIYTGLRITELLEIKINNVNISEKYMRGGIKTDAGINRVIPLHERIIPLIENYYNKSKELGSKYLIANSKGNEMSYTNYRREKWNKMMEQLEFNPNHKPHDTRHTFATMMDRTDANKLCIKRILGHASTDITSKVYTHKDIEDLIQAVNYLN